MSIINITQNDIAISDVVALVNAAGSQDTINVAANVLLQAEGKGLAILADGFGDTINLRGRAEALQDNAIEIGTAGDKASGGNTVNVIFGGIVNAIEATAVTLHGTGNRFTNAGVVQAGADAVFADGATNKLINSGVILAGADAMHVTDDNATVVNSGFASGGTYGIEIRGNHASISNTGVVNGGSGAMLVFGEGASISNYGSVSAAGIGIGLANDDGIAATIAGVGHVTNHGNVTAGLYGVFTYGDDIIIRNGADGTIKTLSPGGQAVRMDTAAGQTQTFLNEGVVTSKTTAIQGGEGSEHVTNKGTLTGQVHLGGGNDVFNSAIGKISGLIDAGAGNDAVIGSAGANTILGGTGADKLTGGLGADTFIFKTLADSTVGAAGRDTLVDFSHAQIDHIDLHLIDAQAGASGNQAFAFLGTGAFGHHAGELHYAFSGTNTVVTGDVDGDAKADFSILLAGHVTLTSSDFLL